MKYIDSLAFITNLIDNRSIYDKLLAKIITKFQFYEKIDEKTYRAIHDIRNISLACSKSPEKVLITLLDNYNHKKQLANENKQLAKFLLNQYPDINHKLNLNAPYEGRIALHLAVRQGYKDIVQCLVKKGADVHAISKEGRNALHLAVLEKNMDIVQYLVEKGANVNTISKVEEHTPLHLAVEKEDKAIVQYLVKNGAKLNATAKKGCTPLDIARELTDKRIFRFLKTHEENNPIKDQFVHDISNFDNTGNNFVGTKDTNNSNEVPLTQIFDRSQK